LEKLHSLLRRQIKRQFHSEEVPKELEPFIQAINESYWQYEDDRAMLERTLELSSQELLHANSEMQAVFQALPDLYFRVSSEGKILDCKGGAGDNDFLTPEKLIGKRIQEIPIDEVASSFSGALEEVRRHGHLVRIEYPLQVNSRINFYEARIVPLLADQMIIAVRNITVLKEAQEELLRAKEAAEEASRTKSQFLANMSHELRTPLNAIIGYSEILEEEASDDGATALVNDLRKIQSAGKHLLTLINDILDLSKIEAGKMELFYEEVDLAPILQDVGTTMRPVIEKNGNTLKVMYSNEIGSIRADVTRLRQVLFNLMSNAGKFTENGTVRLEVAREISGEGNWITFRVADTGIGMTPEHLTKLFKSFSQADSSTTRKYGGTGLGLVVSRRFCQMMGGDISAESEQGRGSAFTVRLPGGVTEVFSKDLDVTEPVPVVEPHGSTVLVIDDDPAVRDLLRRFLAREGFQVITAAGGKEGLSVARQNKVDVITLDVMMPGMDGWAVLQSLKADPQLAEIPVIMITIVDAERMGYALGVSEYLTKPINWQKLSGVLDKYRSNQSAPILVVEDDESTRELLARTLQQQGWNVNVAENGKIALRKLQQDRPGLILLDLMMPEMDGFEFVDHLRNDVKNCTIPVVVVTAKDITQEDIQRLNGFVKMILPKGGYSFNEMLREVHHLVMRFAGLPIRPKS